MSDTFAWRDPSLDGERLVRLIAESLVTRNASPGEREARLLEESWSPPRGPDLEARLALHFMERFAPITQRVPGGLAYTAITTMRLEKPLGQQEEFNRATMLFAQWCVAEIARLRERVGP